VRRRGLRHVALAGLLLASTLAGVFVAHIAEDDPRWKCHLMGNRVCGFEYPADHSVMVLVHFNEDGEQTHVTRRVLDWKVSR
jgi:hypothetical protein